MTGGEVAAMCVIEATARLVPGVLGNLASTDDESHADGLLEYPQYTRPEVFRGVRVPEVLLSGHHGDVARWRREAARAATVATRPDLLNRSGEAPAGHAEPEEGRAGAKGRRGGRP